MKTHRKLVLAVLMLAAIAMAGCSDDDSNPTAPGAPAHSATAEDGDLQLSIGTDKASYAFGEDIVITMTLKNTGSDAVPLDFARGNPARYSNLVVNVDDSDGVGHFIDGDGTADKTSLAAGAKITYSWVWNQNSRFPPRGPVDRGFFEVIGFIGFDDRTTLKVEDLFIELK